MSLATPNCGTTNRPINDDLLYDTLFVTVGACIMLVILHSVDVKRFSGVFLNVDENSVYNYVLQCILCLNYCLTLGQSVVSVV